MNKPMPRETIQDTLWGEEPVSSPLSEVPEAVSASDEEQGPEKLSEQEIEQLVLLFSKLQKGELPLPVFLAVAEKVVTPTTEFLPIRTTESGEVQILLTKRPDDDAHWPGQWHMPGSVIRATDKPGSFESAYARVLQGELGGKMRTIGDPQLVYLEFGEVLRGWELDAVHYIEVESEGDELPEKYGRFFSLNALPENIIEHHKVMIPKIIKAYSGAVRGDEGRSPHARAEAALDGEEWRAYEAELARAGIGWSGAFDPRHGARYSWQEYFPSNK